MSKLLTQVLQVMPELSQQALDSFTQNNYQWNGANWDDVLDRLLDSDSHLEVTEPAYDAFGKPGPPIALTLLYAYGQPPSNEQIQYYVSKLNEVSVDNTWHDEWRSANPNETRG